EIAQIMSARHFVEVRCTHGGPAPPETARALALSRQLLERDGAWIARTDEALAAAEERLQQRVKAL
ncbi:MAG: argininosuccinate lyase, partial [Vicinamibacterales bacterium]